jgi:aspartate carbamoyltransferase catalytic subunit
VQTRNNKFLHILRSQQFSRQWLENEFFPETLRMKNALASKAHLSTLSGKTICLLFYEPSTRTRVSFQQAALKLGAQVAATENAKEFSSAIKGESMKDTMRVINSLQFDAVVIRSDTEGAAEEASSVAQMPVINAGDGAGQHPTQALLDLYTIYEHFKNVDGLKVALVGDLKNGRTTRSLAYLLGKFENIHFELVAPDSLQMRPDILDYFKRRKISFSLGKNLADVADKVDVIYMTRAQKERMNEGEVFESDGVRITKEVLKKVSSDSIIMHPLPRSNDFNEIPEEFTEDARVVIFQQVENGLYTRMALLNMVVK